MPTRGPTSARPAPRGPVRSPRRLRERRWLRASCSRRWSRLLVFLVGRTGSANALAQIDANSAGAIDPGSNRLVDQVRVGAGPGRIAAGFGSLWVVNDYDNTVSRIDPATGTRTDDPGRRRSDRDRGRSGVRLGRVHRHAKRRSDRPAAQQAYAADPGRKRLERDRDQPWRRVGDGPARRHRDRDRLEDRHGPPATLDAGPSPSDIAYGLGALWIANESSSTVTRLDPRTGGTPDVQRRQRARGGRDRERLGLGREQPRRNRLPHRSEHATSSRP